MKGEGKMAENTTKKPEKNKFSLSEIYKVHLAEFKRVIWPGKQEVIKQTIIVIVISLILGLIIWGLDIAFEEAYKVLIDLVKN